MPPVRATLPVRKGTSAPGTPPGPTPEALSILEASLPGGADGVAYSATLHAAGGTAPYSWAADGLPSPLEIDTDSGVISGTPDGESVSEVDFTVTDAVGGEFTRTITLTVTDEVDDLVIATPSLPGGAAGVAYSFQMEEAGGVGPFAWTSTAPPSALALSSGGLLFGTPAAASSGDITFTVTDQGMGNITAQKTLTLTVAAAPPEGVLARADLTLVGAFRPPTSAGGVQIRGNPSGGGGLALRRVGGQVRLLGWTDNSNGGGRVYEMTPPADIGVAVGTRIGDGPLYTQATLTRDWGDITGGRRLFRYSSASSEKTGLVVSATATTIRVDKDLGSGVVGRYIGLTGGPRAGRAVKIGAWDAATFTCTLASGHAWASTPQAGDPWKAGRWADSPSEPHGLTWIEASQRLYWSYGVAYGDAADNPCLGFSKLNDSTGEATAHGPFGRFGQLARGGVTPIPASWSAANAPGKTLMAGNGGYYSTFSGSIGCAARAIAEPPDGQQGLDFSQAHDGIPPVDTAVMMSWPSSSTVRGPRDDGYLNGDIFLSGGRCDGTLRDGSARSMQLPAAKVPYRSVYSGLVDYGAKAATVNGSNVVTLNTTVNLSGVATDGSVLLWIAKSSSNTALMEGSPITGIGGSSGNWAVTTRDGWAWSGSGLRMIVAASPNSQAYPVYAPQKFGWKATTNGTNQIAITWPGNLADATLALVSKNKALWVGTGGEGTEHRITALSGSAPNWTVTCSGTFPAIVDAPWGAGGGRAGEAGTGLRILMRTGPAAGQSRKIMAWTAGTPDIKVRNCALLDATQGVIPGNGDTYTLYKGTVRAATSTTITLGTGEATTLLPATQVEIVAGTGDGQVREIVAGTWDGAAKSGQVAAWDVTPDATSKYNLVTRGTTSAQVMIDPSGGFHRMTWSDYLAGNSCVWIEGEDGKGVLYLPSLAVGCVSYYEAALVCDGHKTSGMIFDPDDLAAALAAGTPTAPLPVHMWALSDDIPEFNDDDPINPYSAEGFSGNKGSQVMSGAFDATAKRLYVMMQRAWNSGAGASRPTVYVYDVDC